MWNQYKDMFRQEPKKGLGDFDIEEEVKVGGLFKPKEIKVEESKEVKDE